MKKENNYLSPQSMTIVMVVEQCFATSDVETSDGSFTLSDFMDGGEL